MKFLIVFVVLLVLVAVVIATTRGVSASRRPGRPASRRDGGTDAGPAYWAGDGGASYGDGRDRDSGGGWDGGADGGSDGGGGGGGSDGGGGGGGGD